jgi:hypothetical protein
MTKDKDKLTTDKTDKKTKILHDDSVDETELKKRLIIDALESSATRVFSTALKLAGVSPAWGYTLRARDADFDKQVREILLANRQTIMDGVENQLYKIMLDEKAPCKKTLRWFADRQGKDRGYVTRIEQVTKTVEKFDSEEDKRIAESYAERLLAARNNKEHTED